MSARRPAGGRGACDCSNITIMQLFHELKQQFPAVPDEVVNACISAHCHDKPACERRLRRAIDGLPRALAYPPSLMGATARLAADNGATAAAPCVADTVHRIELDERANPSAPSAYLPMAESPVRSPQGPVAAAVALCDPSKPPISPSSAKRFLHKAPPSKCRAIGPPAPPPPLPAPPVSGDCLAGAARRGAVRPSTLDLPKKTENEVSGALAAMNLSVNVNCSVDVVKTPPGGTAGTPTRHSAVLEMTPEPTWCPRTPRSPHSPRSFTSVNLTLRTPTSEPQPPIEIYSANSSLTYTTSSFDSRQGLQSRLQITVGPGGDGNVWALRTRPRSAEGLPTPVEEGRRREDSKAGSMPDLTDTSGATNHVVLVSRQLERKEMLRNDLEIGKERLIAIRKEVLALQLATKPECRERLRKEIKHLQSQCDRLTQEVDRHSESRVPLGETNEEFYRDIYTGQQGSLRMRRRPQAVTEQEEPRWPCHICTFRNHHLMDKCEQCEMPRIVLVSAGPGDNIHIRFTPGNNRRVIHSWVV